MIGRYSEFQNLMKNALDKKSRLIQIEGIHGIGKTRLVLSLAEYINQRKLMSEGVYYLNFERVQSHIHITSTFERAGIIHILEKIQRSQASNLREMVPETNDNNSSILLIYDNVDHLLDEQSLLSWHLKVIFNMNSNIKIILTSSKAFLNKISIDSNVDRFHMKLQTLSRKHAASLVLFYALRKLVPEDFNDGIKV